MKKISLFLFIFVFNLLADRGGWILTKSGEIKGKEVLSEPLQKAVLYWDGEKEILILGVNIKSETRGKLISFIPLPSKPKIKKAPGDIFKKMDNLVKKYAPVFEIYKPEILRKLPEVGIGKMKLPKRFKHSDIKSKGYVVIFSGKIGVHNLRVVYAENIDSFVSWVKRNYKNVPKNIERIVKLYIKNGKKYFVFDEVEIKDSANIKPLMYEFKSKSLYYPLRVNLFYRDTAEIVLYVLTNRKIPFGLFSSKSLMPILLYNFDIDFDKLPKWFAVRVKIEGLNDFMKYKVFNFRDVWQRLQFKKFLGEYRPVAFRVKEIEKIKFLKGKEYLYFYCLHSKFLAKHHTFDLEISDVDFKNWKDINGFALVVNSCGFRPSPVFWFTKKLLKPFDIVYVLGLYEGYWCYVLDLDTMEYGWVEKQALRLLSYIK